MAHLQVSNAARPVYDSTANILYEKILSSRRLHKNSGRRKIIFRLFQKHLYSVDGRRVPNLPDLAMRGLLQPPMPAWLSLRRQRDCLHRRFDLVNRGIAHIFKVTIFLHALHK